MRFSKKLEEGDPRYGLRALPFFFLNHMQLGSAVWSRNPEHWFNKTRVLIFPQENEIWAHGMALRTPHLLFV